MVLVKSKDKPPSDSSKEAGRNEADNVLDGETNEPSEETNMVRKPIFEVSDPTQAFVQSAFCRSSSTDNKMRRTLIECFSVPEGDETCCLKFDSILKSELPKTL